MNAFLLAFSIVTFLGVCLFLLAFRVYSLKQQPSDEQRLTVGAGSLVPGFLACFMQIILLVDLLWNETGQLNMSITNAFLVCAFIITFLCLIICTFLPITQIVVIFLPVNMVAVMTAISARGETGILLSPSASLQAHILLSISAYSVLAFASLIAILFACKNWQVKHHKFGILWQTLPSLQSLERLMFQVLIAGFILLTLGVLLGFADLEKWFTHKVIFSIIAWLVFATLLMGRYFSGWRGQKAIKLTLTGMVFLILAFFGSKFVLEILLQ